MFLRGPMVLGFLFGYLLGRESAGGPHGEMNRNRYFAATIGGIVLLMLAVVGTSFRTDPVLAGIGLVLGGALIAHTVLQWAAYVRRGQPPR